MELCETPSTCTQPRHWEIEQCGMEPGIPRVLGHHCSPPSVPWGCSQPCPCGFSTGMSLLQHQGLGERFGDGLTPALDVTGDGCQCSLAVTVSQQWFVPVTTSETPPADTQQLLLGLSSLSFWPWSSFSPSSAGQSRDLCLQKPRVALAEPPSLPSQLTASGWDLWH